MNVSIRIANPGDANRVRAAYEQWQYTQNLSAGDVIWLAEDADGLLGLVRIANEHGVQVLRGMRVAPHWQRRGIGTRILRSVAAWLDKRECYCLPYRHLKRFYENAGFREIALGTAPEFLRERLRNYQKRGLDIIPMMRTGGSSTNL